MADITETLLDYCDCDGHGCEPCYAAEVIRRLRAAVDSLLADIDSDHEPEWSSDEAKTNGKKPWCCRTCGAADGGWPCTHRMALDELREARRG